MSNKLRDLFIFIGGVAIGAFLTDRYLKNKYEAILQEELESIRSINKRTKGTPMPDVKPEYSSIPREEIDDEEIVGEVYPYSYREEFADGTTVTYSKSAEDRAKPYVITPEEFYDDHSELEKVTITYYDEDDTLVDEEEEIIDEVNMLIGAGTLERFGEDSDDPDVVYIRNERINTDYEIIRQHKSFKEYAGIE